MHNVEFVEDLDMTVEAEQVIYKIDPNEMLAEYEDEDDNQEISDPDPQPNVDDPVDASTKSKQTAAEDLSHGNVAKKRNIKEAFGSDDEDVAENAVKKKSKQSEDHSQEEDEKASEGAKEPPQPQVVENKNIKMEIVESEQSVDMPKI